MEMATAETAVANVGFNQLGTCMGERAGAKSRQHVLHVVAALDGMIHCVGHTVEAELVSHSRGGSGQLSRIGFSGLERLDSFVQERFILSHRLPHSNSLSRFFSLDLAL
jgi:hypothetical protein